MTAFDKCFMFLDNPHGGVENLADMKAAGFDGVFCNVIDYPVEEWESVVLPRARSLGMFCGPWGRTGHPPPVGTGFEPVKVDRIVAAADKWQSPGIINSEKEIDGTGSTCTSYIRTKVGARDFAMSTEPTPYDKVQWTPVEDLPILAQIFPAEQQKHYQPDEVKAMWWAYGIKCVYMTYGTYGGMTPALFDLKAPYSIFTGDAVQPENYALWKPTSTGYVACKQSGGTPVPVLKPLTPRQLPYTGPYGLPNGPFKSKGPTAESCKRFFGRLGYLPWRDYDFHWNAVLGECMVKYKKAKKLSADPSYGPKVWEKMRAERVPKGRPNAGQYCFDFVARKLVQDEAGETAGSDEVQKVQQFIVEFWNIAINNASIWHYDQDRPGDVTVAPDKGGRNDCSLILIQVAKYAETKSGITVPDPSKFNYSGYGNTDRHEDDWPKIGSPFRVGDIGHFHSERHVIQCIKPGTIDTAEWGSNGREEAPERIKSLRSYYRYPDEFLYVVRPPLTMEEFADYA
jgi:hypothetical protein